MPGTTLVTQTTAPFWLNKYFEIWAFKDFRTHCKSCFGVRKTLWASQTSFMLQSTANSSAMVPRMIWDHVVFGPKIDQNPGFLGVLQNSSKLGFLGSKTLKNTQKHSKTLKNTQKRSQDARNSSSNTQGTRTTAKFQISQKTQKSLCKGPKRLRRLFLAVTK